jgi:hypothetical protein
LDILIIFILTAAILLLMSTALKIADNMQTKTKKVKIKSEKNPYIEDYRNRGE